MSERGIRGELLCPRKGGAAGKGDLPLEDPSGTGRKSPGPLLSVLSSACVIWTLICTCPRPVLLLECRVPFVSGGSHLYQRGRSREGTVTGDFYANSDHGEQQK